MEDGEGGEDESMQEGAEEGRRPLFRKSENQPSSQEVQEHMKTHIPFRSWCAHCVRGRRRNDPHRSGGGRRTSLIVRQIRGATRAKYGLTVAMVVPWKDSAAQWIAMRVEDWLGSLGSQTVTTSGEQHGVKFEDTDWPVSPTDTMGH